MQFVYKLHTGCEALHSLVQFEKLTPPEGEI